MRLRHNPARAAAAVAAALAICSTLAGCSDNTDESGLYGGSATTGEIVDYVDSLRGVNDLAHGSLDIPPMATLSRVAAVAAAERYVGNEPRSFSDDEIASLAESSPEAPAAIFTQLCIATGGDSGRALQAMPADARQSLDDLTPPRTETFRNATEAALAADVATALECLDENFESRPDVEQDLAKAMEGSPLAIARARYTGAISVEPSAQSFPQHASRVAQDIEANGCTDWNQAAAAMLAAAGAADNPVKACAEESVAAFTDPDALAYMVGARVAPQLIARYLDEHGSALETALTLDYTYITPGDTPVGYGTLSATRDAVWLLWITGAGQPPQWMISGIARAVADIPSGELSTPEMASTITILCAKAADACSDETRQAAEALVKKHAPEIDGPPPEDDGVAALTLRAWSLIDDDSATVDGRGPQCTSDEAQRLFDEAPQTLSQRMVLTRSCEENLPVSVSAARDATIEAFKDNNPHDAAAYALIAELMAGGADDALNEGFYSDIAKAYMDLVARADNSEGSGYVENARPLSLELVRAEIQASTYAPGFAGEPHE